MQGPESLPSAVPAAPLLALLDAIEEAFRRFRAALVPTAEAPGLSLEIPVAEHSGEVDDAPGDSGTLDPLPEPLAEPERTTERPSDFPDFDPDNVPAVGSGVLPIPGPAAKPVLPSPPTRASANPTPASSPLPLPIPGAPAVPPAGERLGSLLGNAVSPQVREALAMPSPSADALREAIGALGESRVAQAAPLLAELGLSEVRQASGDADPRFETTTLFREPGRPAAVTVSAWVRADELVRRGRAVAATATPPEPVDFMTSEIDAVLADLRAMGMAATPLKLAEATILRDIAPADLARRLLVYPSRFANTSRDFERANSFLAFVQTLMRVVPGDPVAPSDEWLKRQDDCWRAAKKYFPRFELEVVTVSPSKPATELRSTCESVRVPARGTAPGYIVRVLAFPLRYKTNDPEKGTVLTAQ